MGILELFILAVGVSMDAFAVSICKGLHSQSASPVNMAKCGLWFGGFQALMPLIGFSLGSLFADAITSFDHWVAFILLAVIGANMLKEALSKEKECCDCGSGGNAKHDEGGDGAFSVPTMLTMAIATSIDALAIGVSLSLAGNVNIFLAISLIGATTCVFSAVGVKIGCVFGGKFEKKAQVAGGVILVFIGLKILLEHLGLFA